MYIIGDVHGQWKKYFKIIKNLDESIQVGDFGIGFNKKDPYPWYPSHTFIRGNHDNPAACQKHANYLGDYGMRPDGIFYVGGGYSIDYKWRQTYNYSHPDKQVWWEDEEILESEFLNVLDLYENTKPDIVISHDCPDIIKDAIIESDVGGHAEDKRRFINRTCDGLLPEMFKIHQPKLWVFGHYHCSFRTIVNGTTFICLKELEVLNLDDEI